MERVYPLTRAQERLFFLHRMDADAGTYAFPIHLRLRGPLEVGALESALADVVERHEVLRSTIDTRDGRPVQIVGERGCALRHLDLRGLPEAGREQAEREAVDREYNARFDFHDRLMRALLVRRADEDFLLLLTFHHIVFDGWSVGVLMDELSDGYLRHRGLKTDPVEPLPLQYGEYAAREAQTENLAGMGAQEAFWKQRLSPTPPNLRLPTDRPRPEVLSGHAHRVWTYLDADLTAALEQRARQQRATLHMLLLTAYQALLGRLAGQNDFCVGGATSGRHDPATHPMIGTLVNELVYRSEYEPGLTYEQLIARVRRGALDVYRHNRLPFERLVELVTPVRSLSHHPLFQHAVTLQPDLGGPGLELEGIEVSGLDSGAEGSALDLTVSFHYEGERLACVVDHSVDLWDAPWGQSFAVDLVAVLRAMAEDPGQPVDSVRLSTAVRGFTPEAPTEAAAPADKVPAEAVSRAVSVLSEVWKEILGLPSLASHQNFFDIGGDSLIGLRVVASVQKLGYPMRLRHIFLGQTVEDLAVLLVREAGATRADVDAGGSQTTGTVPLLPIQSWFLATEDAEAGHYNYSNVFDLAPEASAEHLAEAVDAALAHHDAFRLRFGRSAAGKWEQSYVTAPPSGVMRTFDLSRVGAAQAEAAYDRAVKSCQSSIGLARWPLVSCALFLLPEGGRRLLLTAHHLVMEPASMSIVADDIATACRQLARGDSIDLLPQRSSYQDWGRALEQLAFSKETRSEIGYWREVADSAPGLLRVDLPDGKNDVASQVTLIETLSEEETAALRRAAAVVPGAGFTEAVIAGSAAALRPVIDGESLLVDFETHGREDLVDSIDLTRTVGWFAALFPIGLRAGIQDPRRALEEATRDLRGVPRGGLGHGLLTFMSKELPYRRQRVGVTYLGAVAAGKAEDAVLTFAGFPKHDRAARMTRPHELEITAIVADGELSYSITFSTNRYPEQRIKELLAGMRAYFLRLIAMEGVR